MHSPWNYSLSATSEHGSDRLLHREGFPDVQQQLGTPHQRWGGDLELASPYLLQEGLIDTVQVWGSDLELASPGGFDSCIMDSSWTSSKDHSSTSGPGQEAVPSPTSSAVSIRNLSHHSSHSLLASRQQQQQQQQPFQGLDYHMDVSSSSSVSSWFNRASISGNSKTSNLAGADSSHSDALSLQQRSNCGGDESVGSPSGGSIGFNRNSRLDEVSIRSAPAAAAGEDAAGAWDMDYCVLQNNDLVDISNDSGGSRDGHHRGPTERMMDISLEELSRYFTMPITQASKELKVGLTVLKKRCREFGIPRWPHRKLKSLESLIHKSQELAKDAEGKPPNPVVHAVQELEKQKKRMEESPGLELDDRTKRFRQAIFKASYKQRRRAISKEPHMADPDDTDQQQQQQQQT